MTRELVLSYVNQAIENFLKLPKGTKSKVAELFPSNEWLSIDGKVRRVIGQRFFDKIKERGLLNTTIVEIGRHKNSTVYMKTI